MTSGARVPSPSPLPPLCLPAAGRCPTQQPKQTSNVKPTNQHNIRSGTPLDPECPPEAAVLAADAAAYLVIDTNLALHHLDLLEHAAVTDVVVTKTVLEEVLCAHCVVFCVCIDAGAMFVCCACCVLCSG
jgi:hypothetical protein